MKVCLIFPPAWEDIRRGLAAIFPPHGLLSIAAYIEKAGHHVSVIDCVVEEIGHSELEDRIRKLSPDVVGISIQSANRYTGFKCADVVKKVSKNILTVLGGVHATWYDREILEHFQSIDVIVRGEGEETFLKLLEGFSKKDILGITYRDNGRVVQNSDSPQIRDIDSIPFPAFHLVPMEKYFTQARLYEKFLRDPVSMIMTARGCLAKCIFCSTPGMWKGMRIHSPEYVVANIAFLQKNWGVRDVLVYDDTFPLSKGWFNEFYTIFKNRKIDLTFRCLSRVTAVDEEILRKMKQLGCYFIHFGIESGSDRILKRIRKGISVDQIKKAFAATNRAGIMPGMFLMVGFPDEQLTDVYETLKLARTLKSYELGMGVTMVFPGTELWKESGGDDRMWFDEHYAKGLDIFTFGTIPTYESKIFTKQELNYLALNIVHQFNVHNFFRRLYFNLRTHHGHRFTALKNFVGEYIAQAGLIDEYPFSALEKKKHRILDGILKPIYFFLVAIFRLLGISKRN